MPEVLGERRRAVCGVRQPTLDIGQKRIVVFRFRRDQHQAVLRQVFTQEVHEVIVAQRPYWSKSGVIGDLPALLDGHGICTTRVILARFLRSLIPTPCLKRSRLRASLFQLPPYPRGKSQ